MIIRKANPSEIDWINNKYKEVDFTPSNLTNDYNFIAEIDTIPCGLGRLTKIDNNNIELGGIYVFDSHRGLGVAGKIVNHLLSKANPGVNIWCLPFKHLESFYIKLGFQISKNNQAIPDKVVSKYEWCNNTYKEEVLLLFQ
ncbi:GNAT family N-acetyltransferase [Aquimarina sp. 2201CG5-10]|uniref:GNAT family N-acetyltransferase n=1 Tax=Aquimarina callyspongiae TaxID=3098150 RepID=UPI002AB422D4|nr:GNAT family N-acetyltransferase [Aquimarina sp. 2201CG5-10]MDY8135634.1 GNAT family N-acetyltransferase [Aquimarina sp. 2201CG5-10]